MHGDVDTCIYDNFSYPNYSLIRTPRHNLQTKGVRITEDALYVSHTFLDTTFMSNTASCLENFNAPHIHIKELWRSVTRPSTLVTVHPEIFTVIFISQVKEIT